MLVELVGEEAKHGSLTGCGLAVCEDRSETVGSAGGVVCLVAEELRQRGRQPSGVCGFGHLVFDPPGEVGEIGS